MKKMILTSMALVAALALANCTSKPTSERTPAQDSKGTGDINSSTVMSVFGPPIKISCSIMMKNGKDLGKCDLGYFSKTVGKNKQTGQITSCEMKPNRDLYAGFELVNKDKIKLYANINGQVIVHEFEKHSDKSWTLMDTSKDISSQHIAACADIIEIL